MGQQRRGRGGKRLTDLLALFGLPSLSLPVFFNPELPSLGLRSDLSAGDFELTGESSRLRFVLAGLPGLPGADWGKVALLGVKGLGAWLKDLPYIGGLLEDLPDFALNGISHVCRDRPADSPGDRRARWTCWGGFS